MNEHGEILDDWRTLCASLTSPRCRQDTHFPLRKVAHDRPAARLNLRDTQVISTWSSGPKRSRPPTPAANRAGAIGMAGSGLACSSIVVSNTATRGSTSAETLSNRKLRHLVASGHDAAVDTRSSPSLLREGCCLDLRRAHTST